MSTSFQQTTMKAAVPTGATPMAPMKVVPKAAEFPAPRKRSALVPFLIGLALVAALVIASIVVGIIVANMKKKKRLEENKKAVDDYSNKYTFTDETDGVDGLVDKKTFAFLDAAKGTFQPDIKDLKGCIVACDNKADCKGIVLAGPDAPLKERNKCFTITAGTELATTKQKGYVTGLKKTQPATMSMT